MLARILPILALVVLCVLGYWLYAQGTLQQIIRPTVAAVESKRPLIEGQKVRKTFIEVKEIAITRVEPGMITFPEGTTEEEVERALSAQTISRNVDKGRFLNSSMLGESSNVIVLRARGNIAEGDSLTLTNTQATALNSPPPGGAIIFDTEEAASLYIGKAYDLAARKSIFAGQILTIDDAAGGRTDIFVIRTSRDFSRSERLSISGLEVASIDPKDLPSGAIAFQTRGAADVFIGSAGKYVLSDALAEGETIVADFLSSEQMEDQRDPSDLPRTLAELISYMKAYPERAMFMDKSTFIGTRVLQEDETVDIWVEENRSGGAFGQITLTRLDQGVKVRRAEDTSVEQKTPNSVEVNESLTIGAPTEVPLEEDAKGSTEYLWVVMDPTVKKRFDAAQGQGRVAFSVREGESMVDLLGNGAACLAGKCQISRTASDDLKEITEAMTPAAGQSGDGSTMDQDPLAVMDGVSFDLEERLRANGYASFATIAAWQDNEIPAVTIKLDISNNLAFYIREQARNLASSAEEAAQSLGFDEAPKE